MDTIEGFESGRSRQNTGAESSRREHLSAALRDCEQAIKEQPHSPEAYNTYGELLNELGRHRDAVASFDKAIALQPNYTQAHNNRGTALHELSRFEEAVESYGRAISLRPEYAQAFSNRGNALRKLGHFEEALDSYSRALVLLPDHAGLYCNIGNALQDLWRFEEAIESYEKAIDLKPDYAEAYSNHGVALKALTRFDEAMSDFDKALEIDPDYLSARMNKAVVYLLTGRFDLGWQLHEVRRQMKDAAAGRQLGKPRWLGETSIAGKTILIYWEQGFGDVLQFSRYAKLLVAAGARVLLAPHRELQTLMRGIDAEVRVVDIDRDIPLFDCHCPVMSLPLAFKTEIGTIPSGRYISADPDKIEYWSKRLGKKTKPRIGVVWSGNIQPDVRRSIDLQRFQRIFDDRFEFISLQKKVADTDRAILDRANVVCLGEEFFDFSDTAAVCSLTDLVISIDTSVAHLAGALGMPVWVLLPWVADWRWLLDRDDSPWYPSMRLFRQSERGDWDQVLRRVELQLQTLSYDADAKQFAQIGTV